MQFWERDARTNTTKKNKERKEKKERKERKERKEKKNVPKTLYNIKAECRVTFCTDMIV